MQTTSDLSHGKKLVPTRRYSLERFAYQKQAPVDTIVNIVINVVIMLVVVRGLDSVYVMPPPTGEGTSLFGSLFPVAVMTTMITTIMGVRNTVSKRVAGEVDPPLAPGVRWFRPAFAAGLLRSFAALGVISTFGLITHSNWPQATISVQSAVITVGVIAAVLAYIESVAAAFKTRDF
jgi:hypothetical protein